MSKPFPWSPDHEAEDTLEAAGDSFDAWRKWLLAEQLKHCGSGLILDQLDYREEAELYLIMCELAEGTKPCER